MELSYTNKFVEFLNGWNTVIVCSQDELDRFKDKLTSVGLAFNFNTYEELARIAKLNNCLIEDHAIIVEYQPGKGFGIGYASYGESQKWYDIYPWTMDELMEAFNNTEEEK